MRKIYLLVIVATSIFVGGLFTACSNDDEPNRNPDEILGVHYDIWVTPGQSTGMGSNDAIIVQNLKSLEGDSTINFKNTGVDVTAKLYQESIIKGMYYYQIPKEKDRFGKYQIINGQIITVKERPFDKNTYKDRRYTHAWLANNELVVMAANGEANDVVWTKYNTDNMTIEAEGSLDLAKKTRVKQYSTSGLATYRASDNKLIYFFCEKAKKATKQVFAAFINPTTMAVEKLDSTTVGEEMAGTAYGELLQDKRFFDDNQNLYLPLLSSIAGAKSATSKYSRIVRINNGEEKFDKSYIGMNTGTNNGKIVTCDYVGGNKALLYIQDPEHTGTSKDNRLSKGWGANYNCYYALLDLSTNVLKEFTYKGKALPYSSGTFSQRSFILNNKVFIGVNPQDSPACVYVYNKRTQELTKGITIATGYQFTRITHILDK
ncbi:hypothetical protein HMPREF3034_01407 [Prevotella sp. DNF00663]|uniref:hypothetical protein n=1 Tax=Prevotella sp. DNF00663 TaxID=1384078 RepID=UPI0007812FC6|nr:hypothetical protein [Prevotella sp. DNF00663]KXB83164.1 hypothetical protein HMPREF3034_01407 [Prevotella sp. DNF00663]